MWKEFQTATATMKKITTDGYGDETVASSFTVSIDPVLGKKVTHDRDGQVFTGLTTLVTDIDSFDITHDRWNLNYNGREYQIQEVVPFYSIGGNVLEHLELVLK